MNRGHHRDCTTIGAPPEDSTEPVEAAYPQYLKHGTPQIPAEPAKSPIDSLRDMAVKAAEIAEEAGFGADDAMQFTINPVGYLGEKYWDSVKNVVGESNAIQFAINPVGAIWDTITGDKHATGGEVTKSGVAWVDEGEPIVPAEVARDSNLIDLLREASEGGGGVVGGSLTIQNLNVSVPAGSSDPYTFARQFRDALVNELDNPAVKAKIEQVYHRANRGYIG